MYGYVYKYIFNIIYHYDIYCNYAMYRKCLETMFLLLLRL